MSGLARFAALGAALALAGCVTAENSLSQNDIAGMKLTGVTVSYAPDARVQWEDGIRAYATAKAIADDQIATATASLVDARTGAVIIANPDLRAFLMAGQGVLGTAVQAAIDKAATQSVADQVADRYGQSYRDWLLGRA